MARVGTGMGAATGIDKGAGAGAGAIGTWVPAPTPAFIGIVNAELDAGANVGGAGEASGVGKWTSLRGPRRICTYDESEF
jgi:hypothetical protein